MYQSDIVGTPRPDHSRPVASRSFEGMRRGGERMLRRIQVLLCAVSTLALAMWAALRAHSGPASHSAWDVAIAVILFSMYATSRWVRVYVQTENYRHAGVAEAARFEGLSLVIRTLRHHVANKLAVTVGYSELLADDPRLPADAREQANKILTSAKGAADAVHRIDASLVDVKLKTGVQGPPQLDIVTGSNPSR